MKFNRIIAIGLSALLVSCGGGGNETVDATDTGVPQTQAAVRAAPLAAEAVPRGQTHIVLGSDAGDWVGQGGSYSYTKAHADIQVTTTGGMFQIRIDGRERWSGNFALPAAVTSFHPATYSNLQRYPFHNRNVGGLQWSGEGRGCNKLLGTFRINSSRHVGTELVAIDIDFIQHCEGHAPALFGNVRWFAADAAPVPGPVQSVPDSLWSPALSAMPPDASVVYLDSDEGDYIGRGRRHVYTKANAKLQVTQASGLLKISVDGNDHWTGYFQAMAGMPRMQAGWYRQVQRHPFYKPGMAWTSIGSACNTISGWFVVDEITYAGGEVYSLDMRFEQHCEGSAPALRGRIRWYLNDNIEPPGPLPIPRKLWSAPEGATPSTGNYVYLHSPPGDFIGQGQDYLYTSGVNASSNGTSVQVNTNGWQGNFLAMDSLAALRPGFYTGLERWLVHNPARGALYWSGQSRGCNQVVGWYAIDKIEFDSLGLMLALDMRFSQRCEGANPPLRGEVHWVRPPRG